MNRPMVWRHADLLTNGIAVGLYESDDDAKEKL